MKLETIIKIQGTLGQRLRDVLAENDGQYNMVAAALMQSIAGLEQALQLAHLNAALEKLGTQSVPPVPAPTEGAVKPARRLNKFVAAERASGLSSSTPKPKASGQETTTGRRAKVPVRRAFKRNVRVVRPAAPEVASMVTPPADNYSPEFDTMADEGREMDEVLEQIGEQE